MQRAEAQHKPIQNKPVARPARGMAIASRRGERIAQLEAIEAAGPRASGLARLAAMANDGPRVAAQRTIAAGMNSGAQAPAQGLRPDGLGGDTVQREGAERSLQPQVAQRAVASAQPNRTGLPDNLKHGIEAFSGISMDSVRVHYNSSQPAQRNALAYAQGTNIHVAPGQERHLPHEAWHVLPQAQGRVRPTTQLQGAERLATGLTPIQCMTFSRLTFMQWPWNWAWSYNDKEKRLLADEKQLKETVGKLKPYEKGAFGEDVSRITGQFDALSNKEYQESEYDGVLAQLAGLLGEAQTLLTRLSGADPTDAELRVALTTQQGSGPLAKVVLLELLKVYAALPPAMATPTNKGLIKEAIYPDSQLAGGYLLNEYMTQSTVIFAQTRGALLIDNFTRLNKRIMDSWNNIKETFGVDGEPREIALTGSDFHNAGQQVAIVTSSTGEKVVYKPRTISPDAMLLGAGNSAFDDLNKLSDDGRVQLPTMKFRESTDDAGTFSFVEFQNKAEVQSDGEVASLYERYGELAVAAKLFGVNDLHNENIMAKRKTPTIIDAETAFLPFVMQAGSFSRTELGMSLESVEKGAPASPAENFFYTGGEQAAYNSASDGDFLDYIIARRKQDLNGEKNYLRYFEQGMDNIINLVKAKQDEVVKLILKRMGKTEHIRVVPFATQDFHDNIRAYRGCLVAGNTGGADTIVIEAVTKMKKEVKAKGFSVVTDEWDATVTSKVGRLLKADYAAGDTPILHFEPKGNTLLYHGQDVGFSEDWESDAEGLVKLIVRRIARVQKDQIMQDLEIGN